MEQNKKIKALFISSWYPNRVRPTLGNFVQKHAEAVSLYTDVCVLHVCFDEKLFENKFEIVHETNGKINIIFVYLNKNRFALTRFFSYLKAYRKGFSLINERFGKPDIIHANILFPVGLVFYFLRVFKRTPYVITEHWTGYLPSDPSSIGFIRKWFSKIIARKSCCIMPVSGDLEDAMKKSGLNGNYKVVPNVVGKAFFQPSINKTPNTKFRFLHVSSLDDDQKNITGIIRSVYQLSLLRKDFEFTIIGDGNPESFISLAKELNLYEKFIFFESKKSTDELADIMKESDCFVLFSNYESFSIVIAESLASGLPVIATNAGGIAGSLSKEHGIIIRPGDETALLNAMIYMIEHHEEYNKEIIVDFAEQFRYEKVGENFLNIYKQIIH